jgi:uncharacterized protein (DUF1697 family)
MPIFVGLVRAVNLAGKNMLSMSELRDLMSKLGMQDVRTLLQSGNVIFRSDVRSPATIEKVLEDGVEKRFGLKTEFFVRTVEEMNEIVAANPFPREAKQDPGHLVVGFLKQAPDSASVSALQKAIVGREVVRAVGRHSYVVYPDGIGRSKLTSALVEKKLGTRGTGRNWNTVLKLQAIVNELSSPATGRARPRA